MQKILLVKCMPQQGHSSNAINLGYELVKKICIKYGYCVNEAYFTDKIKNISQYAIIGFNVFYLLQQLNNSINGNPINKSRRKP